MTGERHVPPGWYDHDDDTQRYWDGQRWTDSYARRSPAAAAPAASGDTAAGRFIRAVIATWAGFVLGWGTIYLGAQASPDDFYWPIKVVVEESDIPDLPQPP